MSIFKSLLLVVMFSPTVLSPTVVADDDHGDVDIKITYDKLKHNQSGLETLFGLAVARRYSNNTYWSFNFKMAAGGETQGFLSEGLEFGKIFDIGEKYYIDTSFYAGSAQQHFGTSKVFLQPRAAIGRKFGSFSLETGFSWIKITGTEVSEPSINFAVRKPLNFAFKDGHDDVLMQRASNKIKLKSTSLLASQYQLKGQMGTNGEPLSNLERIGIELEFAKNDQTSFYIYSAGQPINSHKDGVFTSEQFEEIFFGTRRAFRLSDASELYTNVAIGAMHGIDDGDRSGFALQGGVGYRHYIKGGLFASIQGDYTKKLNSNFSEISPTVKIGYNFFRANKNLDEDEVARGTRTFFSTTYTYIPSVVNYKDSTAAPLKGLNMISFDIGYYLSKNTFFLLGYTTPLHNKREMYYIYTGLGVDYPISNRLSLTPAFYLTGTASGKGTLRKDFSGLMIKPSLSANYAINNKLAFYVGTDWQKSIAKGHLKWWEYKAGLKMKFTIY